MNEQKEISLKFTNKVTGEAKLERYAQQLNVIKSAMSGFNSGTIKEVEQSASNISKISKDTDKIGKKINFAFNYTIIRTFGRALKSVVTTMSSLVTQSSSFLEDFNLFQVAFNGNYRSAERFVNKLSEMYGLDEGWLTRTTGIFKQLANAMDLSVESGEKLSELMTQMSIDISSLYNVDVDRASQVLQSALAGQTKPIRSLTGGDITQATLQTTLDKMGIDRAISDLSFAEKRLMIIVSLTQQLSESAGDWGRTLESPANQTRILNEQWTRLSRAVGNLLLPIVAKVLPYLNAILMVLTEIINTIASFLGFKLDDYDYFTSMAGDAWDFDDAVSSAGNSVDDLKSKMKGLRGFDKLNVISTPTESKAGNGSAGVGSGIDPAIMGAFNDAFANYQKKLEDVQMKATKIRDKIMEWLGFTKQIDKETGKVSFKFDHITAGTVLGALGVGGFIYNGVRIIFGILNRIGLIDFKLPTYSSLIAGIVKNLGNITGLTGVIKAIGESFALIAGGAGSIGEVFTAVLLPALGTMALKLSGIAGIIIGAKILIDSIIDIVNNGFNFDNIIEGLQGIALIVAGILAFINPIGALIALAVAGVLKLVQIIVDNWDTINNTVIKPIVDFVTSIATTIYNVAIKPIISFFKPIVDAVTEIYEYILKNIIEIVVGVAQAVWSIISKIAEIVVKIVEIFVAISSAFKEYVIKPVWDNFLQPLFNWIYNTLIKPIISVFVGVGTWVYNNIIKPVYDKVVWLRNKVVDIFKAIGKIVVDFISGAIKSVINGVLGGIENTINKFIRLLNGAIKIINKIPGVNISRVDELRIPRLEKGMDFVPKDFYGPVYLDYGERVLTKQENREYSSGSNGLGYENSNYKTTVSPTIIVKVGDKELANQVLDNLQDMAKTNGKPITIGY